jgi:hypothetical protein
MKVYDTPVIFLDGFNACCHVSVPAPYGTKQGFADWRRKMHWLNEQNLKLQVDFRSTRTAMPVDFDDWSDYKWWFNDINNAHFFYLRFSS